MLMNYMTIWLRIISKIMHHDSISNNWNNVVSDFRDECVITMV